MRYIKAIAIVFLSLQAHMHVPSRAQFSTVISVPPDVPPFAISSNTQLNVYDGGTIPSGFAVGAFNGSITNVEVNVFGGRLQEHFNALAGSTINIAGGKVESFFTARSGSRVNVT